jgi:hypothetical protein
MSKFYLIPVSGSGTSLARWTFQSLINISFPKIVGEREEGEKFFLGIQFINNLLKFVQFFSDIFRKFIKNFPTIITFQKIM